MNSLEILGGRIERAKTRRDEALPYSPDWAAAMEEIDELRARRAQLAQMATLGRALTRIPVAG